MRVRLIVGLFALGLLAVLGASHPASADPAITGYPDSIAALGDSITRAVDSAAFGDLPEYSWATGTQASVNPYYKRLLAVQPAISGNRFASAAETTMTTNPNAACGYTPGGPSQSGSWPPDLTESDAIDRGPLPACLALRVYNAAD
jgi:hypothetical protein